jgi:cell division septation protein DedD
MRPVLCGLAAGVLTCYAAVVHAQQGSLQITGAAQTVTGDPARIAGENAIDPDFGVLWLQPGVRFGAFQIELREARRGDRLHLGRNYAALRDLRYRRMSWTFEAGDSYFTRAIGQYGFSNLTTPSVTFAGGAISGRSDRGSVHVVAGRTTAWRNIFGTDPDTLSQWLGSASGSYHLNDRLEMLGRVSRIGTSGLREFAFTIAEGRQAGGGLKFTLTPAVQLIGDGSFVLYRRLDSNILERDGSFLGGVNLLLSRGWVQLNAARFSPGEFPAMNDPLNDRESAFAAGEYDLWSHLRLFGGWESVRTNIDPDLTLEASRNLPRNIATRGFAGLRVRIGTHSALTVRAEEGDRIARPVNGGLDAQSDTGTRTAEWQSMFGPLTAYSRAARRENIDSRNASATYTQTDYSQQLFLRLSRSAQLFGLGVLTRHEAGTSEGSYYWQLGGGAQLQLSRHNLSIRGEATTSRNVDLLTRDFVPRESFNIGVNGLMSRGTSFSFSIAADRTPLLFDTGNPWTTRSLVRLTQSFSTGASRVATASARRTTAASARGTGTIVGSAYADWNANGIRDPDEEPLENIPVRIAAVSSVTTRRDGEFTFMNVPAGPQQVGLDPAAVPIDFDPPAVSTIDLDLDRGATRRVTFGLIPLGSVRGRIVNDANRNGKVDPGEEPIERAVLVLDGGARSEETRRGNYRFDSIRSGDHVVLLLRESLPEGAVITGATEVPLALKRNQLSVQVDFLVVIEKRPENRKVFPAKIGAQTPAPQAPARGTAASAPAPRSPASVSGPIVPPRSTVSDPPAMPTPQSAGATANEPLPFAVQVAALSDPIRARAIVRQLTSLGYPAYLIAPAAGDPDGPYRVRVGGYRTRAAAAAAAARLEQALREKLWVIRETTISRR